MKVICSVKDVLDGRDLERVHQINVDGKKYNIVSTRYFKYRVPVSEKYFLIRTSDFIRDLFTGFPGMESTLLRYDYFDKSYVVTFPFSVVSENTKVLDLSQYISLGSLKYTDVDVDKVDFGKKIPGSLMILTQVWGHGCFSVSGVAVIFQLCKHYRSGCS